MATITIDKSVNADDIFAMSAGTPCFVAIASGAQAYQTNLTGYSTWVTANMPSSSNWQSVCYGNNILVAVSSTSGTIAASSPTGVTATWTARTMPETASWYSVAFGLDTFVALAGGSNVTIAASSTDGALWTQRNTSGTSGDWRALTFGNDRFVAVGYNGSNSIYSTNGTSWTAGGALPATRNWKSVVYGGGKFVAVASGSDKGAYSTDGTSWTEMTMPSSTNWNWITYGNGRFVAVSNTSGTIAAYSDNGIDWNPSTLPNSRSWVGVAYGNGVFTAVASGSTSGGAFSYDGINWQASTTISQTTTCVVFTPKTWDSNDILSINNNATVTVNTNQQKFWNAISIYNGKLAITNSSTSINDAVRFVMGKNAAAATTSACTITPVSGIGDIEISGNWIELGSGSGASGQTMTAPFNDYIPALWVETAESSGSYEVWLNATGVYGNYYPTTGGKLIEGLSAVGSGNRGKFFIQQPQDEPYGPTILNATYGALAQKRITITDTTGLYSGAAVFGPGIPANTVVNKVISSTLIETNTVSTTELSTDWASVAYGNSTYVAVSKTYSNIAATSSDGTTWTKRTLPFVADWTSVCWGATSGLFVAVANHAANGIGYCATSPDGITWTQRSMPSVMNWNSVASNGTSYVAVGMTAASAATTAAASSTDGITWVAATMATSLIWKAVAYGGSRYVAVGGTTATVCNYDADGAGTWTAGATMTSGDYVALAYSGSRWVAISGAANATQYKDDPTTGAFTVGGTTGTSTTNRSIAWDGTNFVIVATTNATVSFRSTNGVFWTSTTLTGTQIGSWNGVCANGSTLVAVSQSGNLRSYAMTSTDSGATWTVRTGMVSDVSLFCINPLQSQLSKTVQFGDGVNGKKIPTNAKVRCPNIMFTNASPATAQHPTLRIYGANMVMTNGGSLTANICLFDDSYSTFTQAETLSLTNCGFSYVPLITECYGLTINSVGFGLEPVRRYFQFSATVGSYGWFTRDTRYGTAPTYNTWNYINGATVTDLNMVIGQSLSLIANQTGATVTAPTAALYVTNTENSTWTNIRFYGLNTNHNFQVALSTYLSTTYLGLFNNNTITNFESYGLGPIMLSTSNNNTITNVTWSEDMFNGYKNMASAYRIGNDPIAGTHLADDTKYYIKLRTFRDWMDRTNYYESRVYSATPYLGSRWYPQSFSAVNTGSRQVTLTWVRRDPTPSSAGQVSYQIFRSTSASFTPSSTNLLYDTLVPATVSFVNGFIATITATASPVRTITFNQAARTIALTGAGAGSFITAGYVVGGTVTVAGTVSNNGTYTILTVAAGTLTLTTNHTNLVNETAPNGATLDGQSPTNGTTYYYKLRKYDSALSGITNAAGTSGGTTLTIPSGSFNTGLGTIINCEGISGSNKIRIPVGSTTNFLAGNVTPGLQIAGTGVGSSATVVSIDSPWQITVSVNNASDFSAQTLTLGAAVGMYVIGPGIARPTKISSIDSATQITVDTAFIATFSSTTIYFSYATDGPEVEVKVNGATTAGFNYLTYSDDFSNATWVKTNCTATTNQRLGPNDLNFGSNITLANTADRLRSDGPTGKAVQSITYLKNSTSYTFSVYVMCDITSQQQTVAGQISIDTTSPTTQAFTANGKWQRITATFTSTSTTHAFTIQINDQGHYIYVANAMVNLGSTALAPILTSGAVKNTVGRTLSFVPAIDGSNTITCGTGSFVTDGYAIGDTIVVSGSASNDGSYVLSNVAAGTLTLITANTLVSESSVSGVTIVGSVIAAAAQELTLAAAWGKSLGGNDTNQGIELTLATLPTAGHYSEIYLGTTSNFEPSDNNRVGYASMPGSNTPVCLNSANDNKINTLTQAGYGGLTSYLLYLRGSSDNTFLDFTTDFNYGVNTAAVADIQNLSNNNMIDDFTIKNWRNFIASATPFTLANTTNGLTIQNTTFNHYDIPYYPAVANSALGVVMKGVSGGHAEPASAATTFALGANTTDSVGVGFTTVYDSMFHELFTSPTTGALALRFNASAKSSKPYSVISGTPAFDNSGKLYFRTAGDSMEITWPHKIYTVSGFRDLPIKYNTYDLGQATTTNPDSAFALETQYAIDTGSGYGAYKVATPANLASESVSTTAGFNMKLKITARAGMMFSTVTSNFVLNETITGVSSGATGVVSEIYYLTTTTGAIIFSSTSGTFIPGEIVKSGATNRATNVATNTQFACFPSFNSYINAMEIYTNTVGPGDYAGQTVNIVLTNVVSGSTYYVYKTSDQTLLGSGTASSSTVTISGVAYVSDFGITVRVRKASSAPKYIPLETQATVNSAGVSVYIGQSVDPVAS